MTVAALQALEGGPIDGDGHSRRKGFFRLLTGFDERLHIISGEKIDARLRDHLRQVVHLSGDGFQQCRASANVSDRKFRLGRHGLRSLVGLSKYLNPQRSSIIALDWMTGWRNGPSSSNWR